MTYAPLSENQAEYINAGPVLAQHRGGRRRQNVVVAGVGGVPRRHPTACISPRVTEASARLNMLTATAGLLRLFDGIYAGTLPKPRAASEYGVGERIVLIWRRARW